MVKILDDFGKFEWMMTFTNQTVDLQLLSSRRLYGRLRKPS
jgi:hypothetical protein